MNSDGLTIEITNNDLSGIVTIEEINYSNGIGFAMLKLKVDGVEAKSFLAADEPIDEDEMDSEATETEAQDPQNTENNSLLSGTVTVSV